jgi:hypothetical protein
MSSGPIQTRLVDEVGSEGRARAAAELISRGDPALSLSPSVVERVGARLTRPAAARPPRRLRLGWVAAAVALLVVPVAMAAVATVRPFFWKPEPKPAAAPKVRVPVPAPVKPELEVAPEVPVQVPVPAAAPAVKPPAPAPVRRAPVKPAAAVPEPLAPAAEVAATGGAPAAPPVGDEAGGVALALEQLHRHRDPLAALATLDAHQAHYPHGMFAREAALARLEALLALGRRADALTVLDGLSREGFDGLARAHELRVLRGELLAQAGDCASAIEAFDAALANAPAAELEGRALFGRASCRASRGDVERSRADLERYLESFPRGPYAAQARAALGR